MSGELDVLKRIELFQGLSDSQLHQLCPVLRRKSYAIGELLLKQGQSSQSLYVLLDGTVKVFTERSEIADVIFAICGPGEVLGELNVVDGLGHSANVATLETSSFYLIDRDVFLETLHTTPLLALNLAHYTTRRLRLATTQIQSLARQDVVRRVASQLLFFGERYGQKTDTGDIRIPLRLTQSILAELIGASRVRVNQVLNSFKRSRYISVGPNFHFVVHNREALCKLCSAHATTDRPASSSQVGAWQPYEDQEKNAAGNRN